MTTTLARTEVAAQPAAPLRALAGIGAALAAVGVGHAIAGLLDPVTSPILAVGSVLIDAAPTPAKEFAVRTFGNYDKPILIGSVGLALMIFAAGLGLIAWRHRRVAIIGISLLGVAGMAAALYRGSPVDTIPSLVAGAVGVLALSIMSRPRLAGPAAPAADRRRLLAMLGGVTLLAAVGGAGGYALDRARQARLAARRALGLPAPASPARAAPRRGPGGGREQLRHSAGEVLPGGHQPGDTSSGCVRLVAADRRDGGQPPDPELRRPAGAADDRAPHHAHLRVQRGRRPVSEHRTLARRTVPPRSSPGSASSPVPTRSSPTPPTPATPLRRRTRR